MWHDAETLKCTILLNNTTDRVLLVGKVTLRRPRGASIAREAFTGQRFVPGEFVKREIDLNTEVGPGKGAPLHFYVRKPELRKSGCALVLRAHIADKVAVIRFKRRTIKRTITA